MQVTTHETRGGVLWNPNAVYSCLMDNLLIALSGYNQFDVGAIRSTEGDMRVTLGSGREKQLSSKWGFFDN